ncbi:prephenate dehydrogenase/arogenate dehydrogenase family protein [Lactococcus hircilactis]|uniref:Prephenate dehydrogenase n=1 Tax=Lactococcus hircilactis TaxID=1494462 RepID=A0A7X1Z9R5_9LACT|nr:prephenate dehydrogenase [Lactococcus hircilactis]MQW39376.1 prephenate dehydrogenase/arogenate dehydrogenase family protein [Lactococcus hircilactis]
MKNIMIIGLGLIGSSIALGIKRDHPEVKIYGVDQEKTLDYALKNDIIDEKSALGAVNQMDVVFLATPLDSALELIQSLSELVFDHPILITDTSSTKVEILAQAKALLTQPLVTFVGGHPMAGSHKSGVHAADVNLFENAYYVLSQENETLKTLLSGLHAKFIIVDAKEHDQVTAQVSHFPHIIASSLIQQSNHYAKNHPLVNSLAAGGFRDMTRIAETNSSMWTPILLSNPKAIIQRIESFKAQLDGVSKMISQKDEKGINNFFDSGKKMRQRMEILEGRGAIPNFYDLYLSVPDEKGIVLRVLALLQDISITNIKIYEENREDIHGQLQISFKNEADLQRAKALISIATDFKIGE